MATINITVPVYGNLDGTLRTVDSVVRNTGGAHDVSLVLVEDSGKAESVRLLRSMLEQMHVPEWVSVVPHEKNGGFIEACYTGVAARAAEFQVLLNSDTFATRGWLDPMVELALTDERIALVNPMTNYSPIIDVPMPTGFTMVEMVRRLAAREPKKGDFIDVVTATGFCLLIKSKYIDEFGFFDRVYAPGYCEETDLHFRFITQGLRSVQATKSFVFHEGEASFSERREMLIARNMATLMGRYQDVYDGTLGEFQRKSVLNEIRGTFKCERNIPTDVLFFSPSTDDASGGVKIIFAACDALNEVGIAANVACTSLDGAEINRNRMFSPLGLSDLYSYELKPKVLAYSLVTNAIEAARYAVHLYEKYGYIPALVHMKQDIEGWFSGRETEAAALESNFADASFAVSPFLSSYFEAQFGVSTEVIQNPISLNFAAPAKKRQGKLKVAAIFRHDQRRGRTVIQEALQILDGMLQEEIEVKLFGGLDEKCGPFKKIVIDNVGRVDEQRVAEILRWADVFVEASLFHGFGLTSLEAAFAGCHVISSGNAGTKSVLPETDSAQFFQIGNATALAEAIASEAAANWPETEVPPEFLYKNCSRAIYPQYVEFFKRVIDKGSKKTPMEIYSEAFQLTYAGTGPLSTHLLNKHFEAVANKAECRLHEVETEFSKYKQRRLIRLADRLTRILRGIK